MYTNLIKHLLIVAVLSIVACKKDSTNNTQIANSKPVIDDGPFSASFGKRISIAGGGGIIDWARNSDEMLGANSSKIFLVHLSSLETEDITSSSNLLTGKNHNNKSVLFIGQENATNAYYEYDFDTRTTQKILTVSTDEESILNKSGDDVFYFTEKYSPPVHCDGFCWGSFVGVDTNAKFNYLNMATKEGVSLKGKTFSCFSKDGSQALLGNFIFNLSSKKIVDSFNREVTQFFYGSIYFDNEPKILAISVDGAVSVRSLKTNQELRKLLPEGCYKNPSDLKWSADGTKVYYIGAKGSNCDNIYVGIYDLATNKEKILVENISNDPGGSNPIESVSLSSDNKRMLFKFRSEYYFKDVD